MQPVPKPAALLKIALLLAFTIDGALDTAVAAPSGILCRIEYGGETRLLRAAPQESPYSGETHSVGSFFRLRLVLETPREGTALFKIYVYADADDGPALIHQAIQPIPPASSAPAPYGFTGFNLVYEPLRDGELGYWCALEPAAGDAR